MLVDQLARPREVQVGQAGVVVAAGGHQHMVDRTRQVGEEPFKPLGIGGVEGGSAARVDIGGRLLEAVGITADEDDVGALGPGEPGRLQPDAGAAADDDDRLTAQRSLPAGHRDLAPTGWRAAAVWARRPFNAATKISENVGNGWIVSRSTSRSTWARMARVACCSHSPASGPSAYAPVNRSPSLSSVRKPLDSAYARV